MNEIEHFFDVEIEQAEERIENEDTMCFNGVKVGRSIGKELNEKHISFCENAKNVLKRAVDDRNRQIAEMQKHIDCLKEELENAQSMLKAEKGELRTRCKESARDNFDNHLYGLLHIVGAEDLKTHTAELLTEPIKVAEMLIYATKRRENCMTGKEYDKPVYEKWQLEQIARHLLVYCGNCEG